MRCQGHLVSGYRQKMRKPIVTFKQFDVVIVPFPFTDTANQKRRPALVISDHLVINATMSRSIMAMITTASHSPLGA